jgi:hypothetical protein
LKQRSEGKEFIQEVNSRNMMKKWGNMEKRWTHGWYFDKWKITTGHWRWFLPGSCTLGMCTLGMRDLQPSFIDTSTLGFGQDLYCSALHGPDMLPAARKGPWVERHRFWHSEALSLCTNCVPRRVCSLWS